MKRSVSKNSWILLCLVAVAWTFSYWTTHPAFSTLPATPSYLGQELRLNNEIIYKAIPQNYHLMHLQIGGSRYYMENTPSWIKTEIQVNDKGNYVSHKVIGSSHEYLEYRLNKYISEIKFLPAYSTKGPSSSSIVVQFVY